MRKCFAICIFLLFLFHVPSKGQEHKDSIRVKDPKLQNINKSDTSYWVKDEKIKLENEGKVSAKTFKPNPTKAVIYSAIFPGLGQIYNRKYWKLPIIYGGYLGLSYAITWNGSRYSEYSDAYRQISGSNPSVNYDKWRPLAPGDTYNPQTISDSNIDYLKSRFRRQRDFFRRNRDLAIIGGVALYAICMIDAYVDAQLFDFDMSSDLSFRVEPTMMMDPLYSTRTFGLQCRIEF